jgi:hypothetical protein
MSERDDVREALAEALCDVYWKAKAEWGWTDWADALLASDAVARIKAEARAEADAVRDRKFGNLRWMDGHQQGVRDGRAEVVAAVEGVLIHTDPASIGTRWASAPARAAFLDGETAMADRVRAALAAVEEGER